MSDIGDAAALMLRSGGWVVVARTAGHVVEARFELHDAATRSYRVVETRTRAIEAPHYSASK